MLKKVKRNTTERDRKKNNYCSTFMMRSGYPLPPYRKTQDQVSQPRASWIRSRERTQQGTVGGINIAPLSWCVLDTPLPQSSTLTGRVAILRACKNKTCFERSTCAPSQHWISGYGVEANVRIMEQYIFLLPSGCSCLMFFVVEPCMIRPWIFASWEVAYRESRWA